MTKIQFCCPKCAFSTTISENEIPQTATQCKCPNCKELLPLSDAIAKAESIVSRSIDQTIEDCFENIQLSTFEKAAEKTTEEESKSLNRYFELVDEGIALLEKENVLEAMLLLEEAEKLNSTPKVRSRLAYCRAKVNQEFSNAINMCIGAIKEESTIADHYFNLGRIYLLSNKRGTALQTFKKGIKLGPHPQLMQELRKFEMRKPSVIPFLPRDHFLNRKLGKLLSHLGFR
jgi:tetratricopeptide (TPR) repeat protein